MRTFLGRTEQQADSATDAAVTTGDDDLPALELTGRLVRFTVRGDVVNWRGVEPPLFTRKRLLVLEGWEEGLLEFFWNLLSGHGLSERRRRYRWGWCLSREGSSYIPGGGARG